MGRYWTYTPNQYTTSMAFTVTFSGGESAVFTYTLTGGTWSLSSGSTGGLEVSGNGTLVRINDNGSVTRIQCKCSNNTKENDAQEINVKRIVFLGPNDIAEYQNPNSGGNPYVGRIYGITRDMWYYFGEPDPVTFTNLTQSVTMPALTGVYGQFYGYGILNCTASPLLLDYSQVQISDENVNGRAKCMWMWRYTDRTVTRDTSGSSSSRGLEFLDSPSTLQDFAYSGNTYYAIPLYYCSAENSLYHGVVDETKYGALRELDSVLDELNPDRQQSVE